MQNLPSSISIIVPLLNEEATLTKNLNTFLELHTTYQLIFVDGGSTDQTHDLMQKNGFCCLYSTEAGRGIQLAAGVDDTDENSRILLFLHVDTKLPADFDQHLMNALESSDWGFFRVNFRSEKFIYKAIQGMMNLRSTLTGIATGDQCIFLKRTTYQRYISELADYPLMEDIYLSKTLKDTCGRGTIVLQPVITSVRYWEKRGVLRTILSMWKYRFLFYIGASPRKLYSRYYK